VKTLVVGQTPPWPETSGARIRLANILRGLRQVGEVNLFVLTDPGQQFSPAAAASAGIRLKTVWRPHPRVSALERLRWLAWGDLPLPLSSRDYAAVRAEFTAWAASSYDLVWFSRPEAFVAVGRFVHGPAIVDLDDLEDRKIAGRRLITDPPDRPATSALQRAIRRGIAAPLSAREARLWRRLYNTIAGSVDAVVVCSEADRRRLDLPNAIMIPNGYAYQAHPAGRRAVGRPPVITFPGFLKYPPNRDAAHFLVGHIAPLIRARLPEVQFRLVGAADESIQKLNQPPSVVVTGFVPEIEGELARTDVIAAPIRFGGGTRIKILEAFAHRIPVVSTSAGVEGIDASPGRDLLVADEPQAFASACIRLLTEPGLRLALVDAAHDLFLHHYRWDHIHGRIAAVAAKIAAKRAQAVHA
jgi:glycosyltransferase involved in cell wall biosynthesis